MAAPSPRDPSTWLNEPMPDGAITVVLADDNLIVRTGVRALLAREADVVVVGEAADLPELLAAAEEHQPQVVVSDIRMPPTFQREGIDAAKEIRQRNPGTGIVILSQYDDPEYAVSLLADGAAGYAYLLKDRLAEGDQLIDAIRAVATGGTLLDPVIVDALVRPVQTGDDDLTEADQELLTFIAEGKPIKAIAVARQTTPEAVSDAVEHLFLVLARGASTGDDSALRRLRMLHQMIVDREEQGETLSRLLPGGLAEKLRLEGKHIGETEELEVTVLMSDIRSYSSIAERTAPTHLAAQLNEHRAAMNHAILDQGGTVMQFVGDAVMAVFGAPFPQDDHADRALDAALSMHRAQHDLNQAWEGTSREEFLLGIGLSTGKAAAALLGSEERLEYTLVGDTVNLAQRLQEMARPGGQTILSEATWNELTDPPTATANPPELVKGRASPVTTYRLGPETWSTA
jgi:adenylate cyclase